MLVLRIVSVLAGLLVLWVVLLDTLETVVLPRRVNRMFRLTAWYYRLTWGPWAAVTKRFKSQGRRESMLGYFGPLSLIFLLALWAAGLIFGFALVVTMPNQTTLSPTPRTTHRTNTILVLLLVNILLLVASIIG